MGYILALTAGFFSALRIPLGKEAGTAFEPFILVAIMLGAAAAAGGFVFAMGQRPNFGFLKQTQQRWRWLGHTAGSGFGIFFIFAALRWLPSSAVACLASAETLFSMMIGIFVLRERFTFAMACATVLILGGTAILKPQGDLSTLFSGEGALFGWGAMMLSNLGFAVADCFVKLETAKTEPHSFIFARNLLLSLVFFVLAVVFEPTIFTPTSTDLPDVRLLAVACLAGVLGMNVGRYFFNTALRKLDLSKTTLMFQSQTFFAFALGYLFFAEVPTLLQWSGAALILLGVLLTTLPANAWVDSARWLRLRLRDLTFRPARSKS